MENKLVVLELRGTLDTDVEVSMRIGLEGQPAQVQKSARLPPREELRLFCRELQSEYRGLGGFHVRSVRVNAINLRARKEKCENVRRLATHLARNFNEWLRSESFRPIDTTLRERLSLDDNIRFIIQTDIVEILQLPWDEWSLIKSYGRAVPAFFSTQYTTHTSCQPASKIRILVILGNSQGIDVEVDRQLLENLSDLTTEVCFLDEPDRQEISNLLWDRCWDIIVFSGHGYTDAEGSKIKIDRYDSLSLSELWCGLRKAVENGLQLAIFNSCDGLQLIRQLDDNVCVPHTIVMRDLVPNFVAQEFLKYFLEHFARGEPLHLAVRYAREQLQALENHFPCASWQPIIYEHPAEPPLTWQQLVGAEQNAQQNAEKKQDLSSKQLPKSIFARFSWRGYLLLFASCITLWLTAVFPGSFLSNKLGQKSYRSQHFERAKFFFQVSILLNSNNPHPHYNLGVLYEDILNDRPAAIAAFQKSAFVGQPEAYAELARLQILAERHEAALKVVAQCLLRHPKQNSIRATCLKHRAWVYWQQDRIGQAERDLQEIVLLDAAGPHAYCLWAQILEYRGKTSKSRAIWEKFLASAREDSNRDLYFIEWDKCFQKANERSKK